MSIESIGVVAVSLWEPMRLGEIEIVGVACCGLVNGPYYSLLLFYITHTASRGTAGALVSHAILQDMHSLQRSITGKRDKNKALMSIHLKELLKKRQTSLTW